MQELDQVLPRMTFSQSPYGYSDITYCGRSTWCTFWVSSRSAFVHGVRRSDRKTNSDQYADDTQLYTKLEVPVTASLVTLQQCVTALHAWFSQNGLLLNPDKSEA